MFRWGVIHILVVCTTLYSEKKVLVAFICQKIPTPPPPMASAKHFLMNNGSTSPEHLFLNIKIYAPVTTEQIKDTTKDLNHKNFISSFCST